MKKDFSDRREDFFQFIWHYQLYQVDSWKTTKGKHLDVVFPGYPNRYSGPDFLNARIKIDGLLWAGHVEIHIRSSDWDRHGHQEDPAYDNVILHVVHFDDKVIRTCAGNLIPTICTRDSINPKIDEGWKNWLKRPSLPCAGRFEEIPLVERRLWLDSLYVTRLERKTKDVARVFLSVDGHMGRLIYKLSAKYLGGHLNAAPMNRLAGIIPFDWADGMRSEDLSAVLLGAAGWLDDPRDQYTEQLNETYMSFLRLTNHPGMSKKEWKWSHMFVGGSPVLRIVQFASMTEKQLLNEEYILEAPVSTMIDDIRQLSIPDYWTRHFLPGKPAPRKLGAPGAGLAERWIINVVVPICRMKADKRSDPKLIDRVEECLERCSPESNAIVHQWIEVGWEPKNALESQAMIELTKTMCTQRKCLNCRIGQKILMSDD